MRLTNTHRGSRNNYREKTPWATPDAPGDERKGQRSGDPIYIQGYLKVNLNMSPTRNAVSKMQQVGSGMS